MNYRSLAGIQVSEIGFGGWGIGGKDWGPTDDVVSIRALNEAFDRGITFYDTAPSYGRSEMLIGETFRDRRDKVVICTKTAHFDGIRDSLRLFGHIDVLLLHQWYTVSEKVVERMNRYVSEGDVRVWGISAPTPLDGWAALSSGVQVIEANLSMMDRRALEMKLPHRVSMIARTPLHFGFLTGTITEDTIFPPGDHRLKWPREQTMEWCRQARECLQGTPPGKESVRKALAWVLAHPVSTCIVGMMTPEQVKENTW